MFKGVLIDYTTLVSANNVLKCREANYPETTVNPYAGFLEGRATEPESPMWLEVTSLADVIEAIVIHEKLLLLNVFRDDRILDKGRYQLSTAAESGLYTSLREAGVIDTLNVTHQRYEQVLQWMEAAAQDTAFAETLLKSFFQILKQPVYASIPDLFSHSQTIYKFDGETVWSHFTRHLNERKFSRQYQAVKEFEKYIPQMRYSKFFYAEDILAFFLRGLLYNEVAKAEAVPYHPHPARSMVTMSDGLWANGKIPNYAEIPIQFLIDMRKEVAESRNKDLHKDLFELTVPPIFGSVLRECKRPEDIPTVAIQMRNSSAAQAFRDWIKSAYDTESGLQVVELANDLNNLKKRMQLELGLETETVQLSLWMFGFKVGIPRFAQQTLYSGSKYHLQFLRHLYQTSLDVMSLERQMLRLFSDNRP